MTNRHLGQALFLFGATACILLSAPCSAANAAFLLSADFSTTSNPNGAWQYGKKASETGVFVTTGSMSIANGKMVGWGGTLSEPFFPFVLKNTTGADVLDDTTLYRKDSVALHPSRGGEWAVVRWINPTASSYRVSADFLDIVNDLPATVDVRVLKNGASIFSSSLNGTQLATSFEKELFLNVGDTLDFQVGNGGNDYIFDHTELGVAISAVPEPASIAVWLAGTGLVSFVVRSRRKSSEANVHRD